MPAPNSPFDSLVLFLSGRRVFRPPPAGISRHPPGIQSPDGGFMENVRGGDIILQSHCAGDVAAGEGVGPTPALYTRVAPQLHCRNPTLLSLWIPLVLLHLLLEA